MSQLFSLFAVLAISASAVLAQPRTLSLDLAEQIAKETAAKCHADGFKVTVLVVDSMSMPKVLLRDDGVAASTAKVAEMKAYSAMLYGRPSGPAQQPPAGQAAPPATIPGTINAKGAVPIKVGDATIGAVAVSGAPGGDKDEACATFALTKLADKLK